MKDLLKQALQKVHDFVNGHEDSIPEKSDPLIARLEEALAKKTAVHIIFAESSFTGDIIKYDTDRQQIIVKNFAKKRQPYYSSVGYSKSNFRSFYYPNGPKKKI